MVAGRLEHQSQIQVDSFEDPGSNPAGAVTIPANKFIQTIFYVPYSALDCDMYAIV